MLSNNQGNVSFIQKVQKLIRRVDRLEAAELPRLTGSKTYDWPNLANGAQQSTTVTVSGASLGMRCIPSMSVVLSGTHLWAEVTLGSTVTVYQRNDTGGAVNVASGTLSVDVWI